MTENASSKIRFPRTFWTANAIELFERAAYYSMASFMVIYLKESLGLTATLAASLNGTLLWGLIYFMPIFSGTMADKYGYKKALSLALSLLMLGYLVTGNVSRLQSLFSKAGSSTYVGNTLLAILGIVLIGIGGSIVKPCVAGTVQKTSGKHAMFGFAVFYMIINIGSIIGRGVSYFVRVRFGLPAIFTGSATVFALLGLVVVLVLYREPGYAGDGPMNGPQAQKKTLGQAIGGIFKALRNGRFVFFLVVIGLFWTLYVQIYNLMPLYLRAVDPDAPMELYTLANPVMIVAFQLLVTRMIRKWSLIKSIIGGVAVTTAGMLFNIVPSLLKTDFAHKVDFLGLTLPLAGIFLIVSIASMAFGEMMASPRIYEYVGSIAPKGEEGLFLGYVNLPIALGSMVGGPLGGALFERFISNPMKAGLPPEAMAMWMIVAGVGVLSMMGLFVYDRVLINPLRGNRRT